MTTTTKIVTMTAAMTPPTAPPAPPPPPPLRPSVEPGGIHHDYTSDYQYRMAGLY